MLISNIPTEVATTWPELTIEAETLRDQFQQVLTSFSKIHKSMNRNKKLSQQEITQLGECKCNWTEISKKLSKFLPSTCRILGFCAFFRYRNKTFHGVLPIIFSGVVHYSKTPFSGGPCTSVGKEVQHRIWFTW